MVNLPNKTFNTALRGYYAPSSTGAKTLERAALIELLTRLPSLSAQAHNDSIHAQLNQHHPGLNLGVDDQAIIMFIDDSLSKALKQVDMEFRVEAILRNLAPLLAAETLQNEVNVLKQPFAIYTLLDQLIHNCAGWSEDLGILGQKYMEKTETAVLDLCRAKATAEECVKQLNAGLKSEHRRYRKLEENLVNSESTRLKQDGARRAAAEMINQQMANQPLALFIIFMLQGAWYEFVQKVYTECGEDTDEWNSVVKLTADLVWSLQPQNNTERQKRLFSEVPRNVASLTGSLSFDTNFVTPCLADIEAEFEAITEGSPSPACDFELLEAAAISGVSGDIEAGLLEQIEQTSEGHWYLYDDKKESDEKIARVKLIINSVESGRLVFTNQNRRKVLTMTYMEFASRTTSNTLKTLEPDLSLQDFMNRHFGFIIHTVKAQKARELKELEAAQRKQISKQFLSRQKTRISDEMQQLKQRAALKKKRALLLKQKAENKLISAHEAVARLRTDAWVKLPLMEGTHTPCKLVAVVSSADKYIFANRAGIKVAEYSANQLSHMIVTENSEILDTGAEFEHVLASVISGLRENRSKSYEQLTSRART